MSPNAWQSSRRSDTFDFFRPSRQNVPLVRQVRSADYADHLRQRALTDGNPGSVEYQPKSGDIRLPDRPERHCRRRSDVERIDSPAHRDHHRSIGRG